MTKHAAEPLESQGFVYRRGRGWELRARALGFAGREWGNRERVRGIHELFVAGVAGGTRGSGRGGCLRLARGLLGLAPCRSSPDRGRRPAGGRAGAAGRHVLSRGAQYATLTQCSTAER